jgi:hypothetical protein
MLKRPTIGTVVNCSESIFYEDILDAPYQPIHELNMAETASVFATRSKRSPVTNLGDL